MNIKKANISDLETVYKITQITINEIYPHYYAKGAVEFFLEHHDRKNIAADIQVGLVFVCYASEQKAIGTVTVKHNEIFRLFVLPEYQGKGFGRKILDHVEDMIIKEYDEIILDASLPAKRMYRKRGYQEKETNMIHVKYGDFLCYDVMSKQRFQ